MSKNNFLELLKILKNFPFSFTINKDKRVINRPDPTNKKRTITTTTESWLLIVNYGQDKGTFKIFFDVLEPGQRSELVTILAKSGAGAVPISMLSDKITTVKEGAKTEPLKYVKTDQTIYFTTENFTELQSPVNLSDTKAVKAAVYTSPIFPELSFLKHAVKKYNTAGISVMYKGKVFHDGTYTSKMRKEKIDPITYIIEKMENVGIQKMMDSIKNMFEKAQKTTPATEPKPQAAPVPVEPLTKITVKKVHAEIMANIIGRDEDQDIYFSWDPGNFTKKWDGKNLVSIIFEVDGFYHQGRVSVTKNQKTGVYAVSLLTGTKAPYKITKFIEGVAGRDLQRCIDKYIEFNGNEAEYDDKIKAAYPDVEELTPAEIQPEIKGLKAA